MDRMEFNFKNIIALTRPHQYIKNLFIFMPLFFVGGITQVDLVLKAFVAFVAFSLSASAIYVLNDYQDIEDDRRHPKKEKPAFSIRSYLQKIRPCTYAYSLYGWDRLNVLGLL